jgi:WD40 repeat protein
MSIVVIGESVSLTASKAVTWRIQEGAAAGSISTSSSTTAAFVPAGAGVFHIIATAADDNSTATALAIVAPTRLRAAGSLATARFGHTATLLPNGKILIVGGGYGPDLIDGFWTIGTAELYDPSTGTFTAAGSSIRNQHTATLLRDGTVLLVGGEDSYNTLNEFAQLYDPTTNTFITTGSLAYARENHTATLLSDGRVLIAGGFGFGGSGGFALASAEIYDPATRRFTAAGNMTSARTAHAATLLTDGTVLITGGWTSGGTAQSAEIYDPASNRFTQIASMTTQRARHSSTLLPDGKVLLAGGSDPASAEIFDSASRTFRATGAMVARRSYHTATSRPDGSVLLVGGIGSPGSLQFAELYQPATGTFVPAGVLVQGRFWHTATTLADGRIVIIGGADSFDNLHIDALKAAEVY